jgi:hypothetical protein
MTMEGSKDREKDMNMVKEKKKEGGGLRYGT